MIKSVLFGIQVYWSQIFLLPQKVLKLIQTACRTFLWTGKSAVSKRALVAWEKICLPKASGGLGIVNLSIWNKAALSKLCWKLFKEKDVIWIKWIHGFYIKNRDFQTITIPTQCCWMIRKILEARRYLKFDDTGIDTMPIKKMYLSILGERTQVGWLACNA